MISTLDLPLEQPDVLVPALICGGTIVIMVVLWLGMLLKTKLWK